MSGPWRIHERRMDDASTPRPSTTNLQESDELPLGYPWAFYGTLVVHNTMIPWQAPGRPSETHRRPAPGLLTCEAILLAHGEPIGDSLATRGTPMVRHYKYLGVPWGITTIFGDQRTSWVHSRVS